MPGFDGTGPRGLGPMTGGGFGYCVIDLDRPAVDRIFPNSGWGPGRGGRPMGRDRISDFGPGRRALIGRFRGPYFFRHRPYW